MESDTESTDHDEPQPGPSGLRRFSNPTSSDDDSDEPEVEPSGLSGNQKKKVRLLQTSLLEEEVQPRLESSDEDEDGIPDISQAEEGGEEYIMPQDNRSSLPRTRYERKLQQMIVANRRARENESNEQKEKRLQDARDRMMIAREGETPQQTQRRLQEQAKRTNRNREEETPEDRERRRQRDSDWNRRSRSAQTEEERQVAVQQAAQARKRRTTSLMNPSFDYQLKKGLSGNPRLEIGGMDVICGFCDAKKFKKESAGLCC